MDDSDFVVILVSCITSFIAYSFFDFLSDELFGWWPVVFFRWAFLIPAVVFAIALVVKIISFLLGK